MVFNTLGSNSTICIQTNMDCLICSKSRSRPLFGSPHLDKILSALGEMFPSFNWIDYSELIIICVNCTKQLSNIKCKLDQIVKLQEEVVQLKGKVEDSIWIGKDHKIGTSQASQSIRKELLKGIETRRALEALEDAEPSDDTMEGPRSPEVMDIRSVEVLNVTDIDQVVRASESFVVSYESQDIPQPSDDEVKIDISPNDMNQEGGIGRLQEQKENQGRFKMNPGSRNLKEIPIEELISECLEKRAIIKLQRIPELAVSFEPASDWDESQGSTILSEPINDLGKADSDEYRPEVELERRKSKRKYTKRGTKTQIKKKKGPFTCSCGEIYKLKGLFHAHRKANNCKERCEICGKEVMHLNQHLTSHDKTKVFQCGKCPAQLRSQKQFKIHVLKHDKSNNILKCGQCDKAFVNNRALNLHVKFIHENKYLACEICGKVMRERHLKNHKRSMHDQDFKYFCPKEGCGKGFIMQSFLTNHLNWHSSAEKKPKNLKCRFCPKLFAWPGGRSTHEKEAHMNSNKCKERCEICGKEVMHLNSHLATHDKTKVFQCDKCPAQLRSQKQFKVHVLKHDESNNILKCGQCDKAFVNNRALNLHVTRIHENKYLACEICGKLVREKRLNYHKRSMHDQDFKYFCPKEGCGKGFIMQSFLTNHLNLHSSDVPRPKNLKCRFCPKLFTWPSSRSTHEKTHKPDKMLKCEMCDAKYPDKHSLNRHMETHSSERKWKCEDCGADFKVKAYLDYHRNRKCAPWPNNYKKKKKSTQN